MKTNNNLKQVYDSMGTIHLVGIGGIGMSGIAEVLFNMGCKVQGSDAAAGAATSKLQTFGIKVFIGHHADHIKGCNVVVVSSAIAADNPEVSAAREHNVPVIKRAEMLAELMRFHFGIAVSGTHGKTTTTSLVAAILTKAGLDPTFVVGGKVNSYGSNARLGGSRYMIAEADESDASFLHLQPIMSIVTNIDADHLAAYRNNFELLQNAFVDFVHNLPFYGIVIACNEDPVVRELAPQFDRRCLTYGFSKDSDFVAEDIHFENMTSHFQLSIPNDTKAYKLMLNLPGRHNVLNALAAIAVGIKLGVSIKIIAEALAEFQGIGRRMQSYGVLQTTHAKARLIDDYGHHPNEIKAVLRTVGDIWQRQRKVLIFQPHRYTRTHALFNDFCDVLNEVEELILLKVYAAGEVPIKGADSDALSRAIRSRGRLIPVCLDDIEEVPRALNAIVRDGDVVLTMGAGSISKLPKDLIDHFSIKDFTCEEMPP